MEHIKIINGKRFMEYPFEQKWNDQVQMWSPITEADRTEWARRMKAKTGYKNPMWIEKHPEYVPPTKEELDAIVFEPYDQVMALKPGTNIPNQEARVQVDMMDIDEEMEGGKRHKRKHHKKSHKKSHIKSKSHRGGKKHKKTVRKHKKTHHKRK